MMTFPPGVRVWLATRHEEGTPKHAVLATRSYAYQYA